MKKIHAIVAGALLASANALPAHARDVIAEPLPAAEQGKCELKKDTPRLIVSLARAALVETTPKAIDELGKHVSPDVVYRDPFVTVKGWPEYRKTWEELLTLDRFYQKMTGWACNGRTIYISWLDGMQGPATNNQYVTFEGVATFVLDENELIVLETDHWNEIPAPMASGLRRSAPAESPPKKQTESPPKK